MKKIYLLLVLQLATFALFAQTPYCAARADYTTNMYDKISRVVLGSIDNASTGVEGYEDFTNLTATLSQGSVNNMSVELWNSFDTDQLLVWIDFNQDGDFDDPGEAVYTSALGKGPFSFTVTTPLGAKQGTTRMRIRLTDTDPDEVLRYGSNSTPCGTSDFGEVEDYTVKIVPYSPYCVASASNGSGNYGKISRVVLGSINNASTSAAGYEDFTNLTATLSQGSANNMSVELSNGYASDQLLVWIDFNQDGDFDDPGEAVYTSALGKGPFSFTVTTPLGAIPGTTRMRIRLTDANNADFISYGSNSTPCGSSDYGQVEDYTVNIVDYNAVINSSYCEARANYTSSQYEKISHVVLGSIDNTSTGIEGYEDFTNLTATLSQGSANNMTVGVWNTFNTDQLLVWIDFNQDGDFDDPAKPCILLRSAQGRSASPLPLLLVQSKALPACG